MTDALHTLEKRCAKLEAALKPFAAEANEWCNSVDGRYHPGVTEPRHNFAYAKALFSLADLRRARALLAKETG